MTDDVKVPRAYTSDRRRAQAESTRRAIIDAAGVLYLRDGYTQATVPAIAALAQVSVPTVYKQFSSKAALAKAVFDTAIAGDHEPVAVRERRALTRVREEPDPRRKLLLYGRFVADSSSRHVPVQLMIRDAARSDDEAAGVWDQVVAERLRGMTMFAESLRATGGLRSSVSAQEARDVLWTYSSPELYELLVMSRGWSPRRFGVWVGAQLVGALVAPDEEDSRTG